MNREDQVKFDHIGMISTKKQKNERFVPATKVWVTEPAGHPYSIEWLRFEEDSPVTGPVRNQPHIAFKVDNIEFAAKGMKALLEPFDGGFARVGFYQNGDGAVIEFMQYYE